MGRKSRAKGNSNELKVCRILSEWWNGESAKGVPAKDLEFRRSPGSGGWDVKRAAGDILKPDDCPLCIEVKAREEWNWDQYFKNKTWPIDGYWEQTVKAAENCGEIPILIFSKNLHPFYVRFDHRTSVRLDIGNAFFMRSGRGFYGFLDTFLESLHSEHFKAYIRDYGLDHILHGHKRKS